MAPKALRVGFSVCHFVRNYTNNSKTKGRTRKFYLSNDYNRGYLLSWLELYVTYQGRVMNPNSHRRHFEIGRFVGTYTNNSKITVCMRTFSYRTTALLSQIYILCVRAGFEIRMASYASKHVSQSLYDRPFLHIQRS